MRMILLISRAILLIFLLVVAPSAPATNDTAANTEQNLSAFIHSIAAAIMAFGVAITL
jgi:hypothetical protein